MKKDEMAKQMAEDLMYIMRHTTGEEKGKVISELIETAGISVLLNEIKKNCYVWKPKKFDTEQELRDTQANIKTLIQRCRKRTDIIAEQHNATILAAINEDDPDDVLWSEYRKQLAELRKKANLHPPPVCDSAFVGYINTNNADPDKLLKSMHALIDGNTQEFQANVIRKAVFFQYLKRQPSSEEVQTEFPSFKKFRKVRVYVTGEEDEIDLEM